MVLGSLEGEYAITFQINSEGFLFDKNNGSYV